MIRSKGAGAPIVTAVKLTSRRHRSPPAPADALASPARLPPLPLVSIVKPPPPVPPPPLAPRSEPHAVNAANADKTVPAKPKRSQLRIISGAEQASCRDQRSFS